MANVASDRIRTHPVLAALIAGALPLFAGALLADIAYGKSFEIQWKNFASWLIVGGLVLAGFGLLWALVDLLRLRQRRAAFTFLALLAAFGLGIGNALIHAKDGWASMPAATILSAITSALAATALAFSTFRAGGSR